ncbi:carboxymuconolactone decarboxylase family protein [Klebsiella spallanzanii]|uniref:carboxymuconolactone decarboxylase family protein n=1 Tax=Klebsiella spallanzanii TaxID=2587528 RepID=UPI001ABA9756|nr:carboxymuconolactone decarboxylase family protein [Klebsiella spallanzanii]
MLGNRVVQKDKKNLTSEIIQGKSAMSRYQSPGDFQQTASLLELAPQEGSAFMRFDHATRREDGHIPPKTREFIALAVALTTQCAYCLDVHSKRAKQAGATREELAELISIAAAVRAGATMGHGLMALRLFGVEQEAK